MPRPGSEYYWRNDTGSGRTYNGGGGTFHNHNYNSRQTSGTYRNPMDIFADLFGNSWYGANQNQDPIRQLELELSIAKSELCRYIEIDNKKNAKTEITLKFLGKFLGCLLCLALLLFLYYFALCYVGSLIISIICGVLGFIFGSWCTILFIGLPLICLAPTLLAVIHEGIASIDTHILGDFFSMTWKPFAFFGATIVELIGDFWSDLRICKNVKTLIATTKAKINLLEEKINEAKRSREGYSQQSNDYYWEENSNSNYERDDKKMDELQNCYDILGLSRDCTDAELRKQYHILMQEYHPDKLASMGLGENLRKDAEEKCKKIIDAYKTICEYRKTV